jgi:hypothetical protein
LTPQGRSARMRAVTRWSIQRRRPHRTFDFGEMAERSKALDWNSSNIFTGVPGFESLSLRHKSKAPHLRGFVFGRNGRASPL